MGYIAHRSGIWLRVVSVVAALSGGSAVMGGCLSTDADAFGPGISVNVAAIDLVDLKDVRYRLQVMNGDSQIVWSRSDIYASEYGIESLSFSYVGPCDATSNPNVVTLELMDLIDADGNILADDEWANPGQLSRGFLCAENQDVSVDFDVTIQLPAKQGFFDIAVEFEDLFCSAKIDCLSELLHDTTSADAPRGRTVVVGLACSAGDEAGVETFLYMNDVILNCTAPVADIVIDPTLSAGQLAMGIDVVQPVGAERLFGAAIYRDGEATGNGRYWNIALGIRADAAGSCTLRSRATVSDGLLPSLTTPADGVWPVLAWDAPVLVDGVFACGTSLDASEMLKTVYTPSGTAETFDYSDPAGP